MYTSKDLVRCVIVAANWRIEGNVHVLAGSRLTDALNSKSKEFIAITDAVVYEARGDGEALYKPPYLALNREAIAVIFPIDEG